MIVTPHVTKFAGLTTAVIHFTVAREEIRSVIGKGIQELLATIAGNGIAPFGPVFAHTSECTRELSILRSECRYFDRFLRREASYPEICQPRWWPELFITGAMKGLVPPGENSTRGLPQTVTGHARTFGSVMLADPSRVRTRRNGVPN